MALKEKGVNNIEFGHTHVFAFKRNNEDLMNSDLFGSKNFDSQQNSNLVTPSH